MNGGFGDSTFGQTNIDVGLAAVNSQTGKFEAIRTTSMMVHGTYFLLNDGKTWVAGGYGTIYSSNANKRRVRYVRRPVAGRCERRRVSLCAIPSTIPNYGTISCQKFERDWRQPGSVPPDADGANFENRRIQRFFFWRF